jgi:hypothetical protein
MLVDCSCTMQELMFVAGTTFPQSCAMAPSVQRTHGVPAEDSPKRRDKLPSPLTGHGSCRPRMHPHVGNAMDTMRAEENKQAILLRLDANETPPCHGTLHDTRRRLASSIGGFRGALQLLVVMIHWIQFDEHTRQWFTRRLHMVRGYEMKSLWSPALRRPSCRRYAGARPAYSWSRGELCRPTSRPSTDGYRAVSDHDAGPNQPHSNPAIGMGSDFLLASRGHSHGRQNISLLSARVRSRGTGRLCQRAACCTSSAGRPAASSQAAPFHPTHSSQFLEQQRHVFLRCANSSTTTIDLTISEARPAV